jgi:UDP-N-acetylglucosamine--N-acetylmuramyl-(pentapeptide) pyrophosphoryl-undecaprenol N-acetylglucosamine transferase
MSHRFIIAGGGTGGHIFPALAIADALRSMAPDSEFQFIGARGKMEMEKIPQAGYAILGLDIVGLDRRHWWKNIMLPVKLMRSFWQVRSVFHSFRPSAVIGVGGYSSFPVLRYAQSKDIPTFLHESNSYAGKSNQWLGKRATRIFTGMTGMEKFFPADRVLHTGNPVRHSIVEKQVDRITAHKIFALDPTKRTLLVIGGSLGARSINQALQSGWQRLTQAGLQIIWQTGKTDAALFSIPGSSDPSLIQQPFIQDMSVAYAAADLVVARAGAMSIAELQVVGKPAILVPFPFAAEDHQTVNAQQLVDAGAAILVRDQEARTQLIDRVLELNADTDRCAAMRDRISAMAIRDADHRVAITILACLNKTGK